jgi:hypothetical protein
MNSGKAADEYGITAEHVKFAGSKIYTLYQDIFNQIFQEGKVAQSFKTGVITPILKKSKDQILTAFLASSMVTIIFFFSSDFDISLISLNRLSLSFKCCLLKLGASFGVAKRLDFVFY